MGEEAAVFAVDRLAARGAVAVTTTLEGEDARAAAAARLRIPAVRALRVDWMLRMGGGGVVEAEGALAATVVQECVVTLDPFAADVAEAFAVRFVPEERVDEFETDDDPDTPDVLGYDGRALPLGEAMVEQLALALDPFPRRPGASLAGEGEDVDTTATEASPSPFAVLAGRRTGGGTTG